jgi:hypothetical protein
MEVVNIPHDIKVFYITAKSYPEGIGDAHNQLRVKFNNAVERKYYGISYPERDKIVYKAGTEEIFEGEGKDYDCETFIIRKGDYVSITLKNWLKDDTMIERAFAQLLNNSEVDENGYCLEVYLNELDIQCMVPLKS